MVSETWRPTDRLPARLATCRLPSSVGLLTGLGRISIRAYKLRMLSVDAIRGVAVRGVGAGGVASVWVLLLLLSLQRQRELCNINNNNNNNKTAVCRRQRDEDKTRGEAGSRLWRRKNLSADQDLIEMLPLSVAHLSVACLHATCASYTNPPPLRARGGAPTETGTMTKPRLIHQHDKSIACARGR